MDKVSNNKPRAEASHLSKHCLSQFFLLLNPYDVAERDVPITVRSEHSSTTLLFKPCVQEEQSEDSCLKGGGGAKADIWSTDGMLQVPASYKDGLF